MTVAVCLRCGAFKHGAFNPCGNCGYAPDDDESLTKHLFVTDHFHSRETLEAIAARVKAGEPLTFDPETLKRLWVSKAQMDAAMERLGHMLKIGCCVYLALVGAVALGVWLWRG